MSTNANSESNATDTTIVAVSATGLTGPGDALVTTPGGPGIDIEQNGPAVQIVGDDPNELVEVIADESGVGLGRDVGTGGAVLITTPGGAIDIEQNGPGDPIVGDASLVPDDSQDGPGAMIVELSDGGDTDVDTGANYPMTVNGGDGGHDDIEVDTGANLPMTAEGGGPHDDIEVDTGANVPMIVEGGGPHDDIEVDTGANLPMTVDASEPVHDDIEVATDEGVMTVSGGDGDLFPLDPADLFDAVPPGGAMGVFPSGTGLPISGHPGELAEPDLAAMIIAAA